MMRFLCAMLLILAMPVAHAQAQPAKAQRILFIGNSLTATTDIPKRLETLARAMGKEVAVDSVTMNGYSLADHWSDGRALAAIRKKGWDTVVLQQGTSSQADSRAELVEYARRFDREIRAAGAKTALYMVWPLSDRPKDFPAAIEAYRAAAQAIDATLLPAGEAWLRVISKDRRARLYGDAIHPSSLGSDLTVLTIYLSLFPAGPTEFDDGYVKKAADALGIDESRRDLYFDAATRAIDEPIALK
jgi:lysophospholipase L1-like esterase